MIINKGTLNSTLAILKELSCLDWYGCVGEGHDDGGKDEDDDKHVHLQPVLHIRIHLIRIQIQAFCWIGIQIQTKVSHD